MSGADAATRAAAARALRCLDLTLLEEGAEPGAIDTLCARACTAHGNVAAVCVFPRFAAQARAALRDSGVRFATVVNFPTCDRPVDFVLAMTGDALAEGAEEIDVVIPWHALRAGNDTPVRETLRAVRRVARRETLKAILETGRLETPALITRAAEIAVEEGADFLKTSTGKVEVNATLEAAALLLEVIRQAGRPVGLKPSGGVRSTEDALGYLRLADRVMGEGWAAPASFRIGASSLLAALLATLGGDDGLRGGSGGY
ncbi:deoxyribose-phosphate aldolase [soil metagenome]